jgi:hypothetical protein
MCLVCVTFYSLIMHKEEKRTHVPVKFISEIVSITKYKNGIVDKELADHITTYDGVDRGWPWPYRLMTFNLHYIIQYPCNF